MENDSANMFCGRCGASLNAPSPAPAAAKEPEKKLCPNCGMANDSTFLFCENCGASLNAPSPAPAAPKGQEKKLCPNCGTANDSTFLFCEKCGASLTAPVFQPAFQGNPAAAGPEQFTMPQPEQFSMPMPPSQGSYTAQPAAPFSMGWHKFLIYFALWAGALMNVVNGLSSVGDDTLYSRIDGLESLNLIYCLVLIALAALCVVTRFQLAGFKRMGPRLLLGLYAANLAVSFLYMVMAYTLMQNSGVYISASALMSGANWALPIVMIIANYVYYKKRAALFVN